MVPDTRTAVPRHVVDLHGFRPVVALVGLIAALTALGHAECISLPQDISTVAGGKMLAEEIY